MQDGIAAVKDISEQIARLGEQLQGLLAEVQHSVDLQISGAVASMDIDEQERISQANPERWLQQAEQQLQMGMMFLRRAVEQPTTF